MVKNINGDLLQVEAGIIGHQTNYYGVMGAGVALAIRENLLPDQEFAAYQALCRRAGKMLLGTVQVLPLVDGRFVANIFSQGEATDDGYLTDYDAMKNALIYLRDYAATQEKGVALPAGMGCGIAGGDWSIVESIIREVFGESEVECTIVKREQEPVAEDTEDESNE